MGDKIIIFVILWSSFISSAPEAMLTTNSVQFVNKEIELFSGISHKNVQNQSADVDLSRTVLKVELELITKNSSRQTRATTKSKEIANTVKGDDIKKMGKRTLLASQMSPSRQTAFLEPIVVASTLVEKDRPVSISFWGEVIKPGQRETEITDNDAGEPEGDAEIEIDTLENQIGKSFAIYTLFAFGACALVAQIILFRMSRVIYKYNYNAKCV